MKNLKRVLSLVLATVMVIGMMVVGASAASYSDFTDKDEIVNAEAVALLNDLKIIEGYNNTYAPDATIDRAGMAKLITKIMMGDVDPAVFAGTETDLTDIDGHWAEGYIKYCYANGIIAGYAGKFAPNEPIDVVGAAKLLLVALGYDAEHRGYVNNSNWSVNIMRDAATTRDAQSLSTRSLTAGLTCKATDPLTRDAAAQMIFNALFVNTYDPTYQWDMGTQHINGYGYTASMASTMYGDPIRVVATVNDITTVPGKATVTVTSTSDAALTTGDAGTIYNANKLAGTSDMLGNSVAFYVKGSDMLSTALTVASSNVLSTVTSGIANFDNAADKTKDAFVAEVENDGTDYTASFFVNGTPETITTKTVGSFADAEFVTAIAKKGAVTEFIDVNGNGKADVVKVTVKNVATLTADASTKAVTGADTQVRVPGVINTFSGTNTVKTVVGYEGLKKGDVVLWVKVGDTTYIEKAGRVTGKVTATTSGNKIVVNGTAYDVSGLAGVSFAGWNDFKNTYDFYLDNYGYVIKTAKVTAEVVSNYAVVLASSWVEGTGKLEESNYAEAKLLFTDGTTKIVPVSKVDSNTIIAPSAAESTAGAGEVNFSVAAPSANTAITNDVFYTYIVDADGNYELTLVSGAANLDSITITNGKANFDGATSGTDNNIGSANTVFVVTTGTAAKPVYTVYTGVAKVPSMTVSAVTDGTVIYDDTGLASYVYIKANVSLTGEANDLVYIVPNASGSFDYTATPNDNGVGVKYYTVKALVNGEEQDVKLDDISNVVGNSAATSGVMYTVNTSNADGVITDMTVTGTDTGISVVGGTLQTNSTVAVVNADTVFYYIAKDGAVSTITADSVVADTTDAVIVIDANSDDVAEVVYILQVEANTAAVASGGVKWTKNGVEQTGVSAGGAITASTGDTVVITGVDVTNMGTYTLDAASFSASGTLTINLTAEDGTAQSPATVTVTFS